MVRLRNKTLLVMISDIIRLCRLRRNREEIKEPIHNIRCRSLSASHAQYNIGWGKNWNVLIHLEN